MRRRQLVALAILGLMLAALAATESLQAAGTYTVTISPTDNAYVAADLNDNGTDQLGLRSLNTANLPILKIWYAWNLTVVNKTGSVVGYIPVKIVTVAYFKFDLSSISSSSTVTNAALHLYAQNSNLTGASRLLVAYSVPSTSWTQSNLDWYTAPGFDTNVNSSTSVTNGIQGWYSLDLTQMAQNATGKDMAVALTFLVLYKHNEEQVVFNSTRASGAQPYLTVTYVGNPPLTLSGIFDFSGGVNSTTVFGVLIIIAVIAVIVAAFWWWRRRMTGPREPKSKPKPGPMKEKVPSPPAQGAQAGGAVAVGAKCPSCGTAVSSDFKLCPSCGKSLTEKLCGNCGKSVKMDYKLCPYCGNKMS